MRDGRPEDYEIFYEDSGEAGHVNGLAGATKLQLSSIADIQVSPDPLGP
jgi:hypothetical protein